MDTWNCTLRLGCDVYLFYQGSVDHGSRAAGVVSVGTGILIQQCFSLRCRPLTSLLELQKVSYTIYCNSFAYSMLATACCEPTPHIGRTYVRDRTRAPLYLLPPSLACVHLPLAVETHKTAAW